jgi:hypothetical protein
MSPSEPKRLTAIDIAAKYDVTRDGVYEWIRQLDLKPDKQSKYAVAPIVEMHAERLRSKIKTDAAGNLLPPENYSDLLKSKQVEKLQVQIDELRGDLWHKDEVLSSWSERNARIKAVVENFRQRETAADGTLDGKALIDDLCDGVLNEITEEFSE